MLLPFLLLTQAVGLMLPGRQKVHSKHANLPSIGSLEWKARSSSVLQVIPSPSQEVIEGFSYAFIGGTVGVMSVALLLELRKAQDISTEACPYWYDKFIAYFSDYLIV